MKKIISLALVCVLMLGCVFTLASCGKTLSGDYQDSLKVTTYSFKGNKVTLTIDNIIGDDTVIEGKYEIGENDEGKTVITFTFEGEDSEEHSGSYDFSEGEEDGAKYIKIGIVKYNKVEK